MSDNPTSWALWSSSTLTGDRLCQQGTQGARLYSRLYHKVVLDLAGCELYIWTDCSIVLNWLDRDPVGSNYMTAIMWLRFWRTPLLPCGDMSVVVEILNTASRGIISLWTNMTLSLVEQTNLADQGSLTLIFLFLSFHLHSVPVCHSMNQTFCLKLSVSQEVFYFF